MSIERMNRKYRLKRAVDFKRVRRTGKSYAHPLAVLIVHPNDSDRIRCGVSASRSVGSAVRRNRAKRLLREALYRHLSAIVSGWDIILVARPSLLKSDWTSTQEAVSDLLNRAGLLK